MQPSDDYSVSSLAPARCVFIGAVAAMLLSACGSSDKPQAAAPVQLVKRPQEPADPTATMAHAVSIGNANVPVNLKYDILNKPVAGSPVEIDLAVVPIVGADSMTITFAGSPGLTLSADAAPNVDSVKAGRPEHVKFSAQANKESVFFVTVTVTLFTAGTSSARNFAIPIIMASATPASAAAPPATKKS